MNYEDDKAAYWRNCDLWTFSEVQCLLDGQWPDSTDAPPSSLSVTLIQMGEQLGADGVVEVVGDIIDPMPHLHGLRRAILDAIAGGALAPVLISPLPGTKLYRGDEEQRFKPPEVIAWATSRGCFPNFPFLLDSLPASMREAYRADQEVAEAEQGAAIDGGTKQAKTWTDERKAEARAYRNQHGLKKTAERYGVSEATISKHIPAGEKKKTSGLWGGLQKS